MKLSLFSCVMLAVFFSASSFVLTLTVSTRNLRLFTAESLASRITSAKIPPVKSDGRQYPEPNPLTRAPSA